jgi:diadenosine tetraphosphate (Ap4A) HIT family hydrolase
MRYDDYLLKVLRDECPFCNIEKNYIIEKWKYFTVLLARAPYIRDHILIVPNRHLIRMWEITPEERLDLIPLIDKWMRKMEMIHSEVNLLLRDWVARWKVGKSIDHLHFHIVPDIPIYSTNSWWNREIYTDYQLVKETIAFKSKFKWK